MLHKIQTNFSSSRTEENRTCSTRSSSPTNWVYSTKGCLNRIMRFLKTRLPQELQSKRSWSTTKKLGFLVQISICHRSWPTPRRFLIHQGDIRIYPSMTKLGSSLLSRRTLVSISCHQRRKTIPSRSNLKSIKNIRGAKNITHQFWATSISQILLLLSKRREIRPVWLSKVTGVTTTLKLAKELFLQDIKLLETRSTVQIITAGIFSWVVATLPIIRKGCPCLCSVSCINPSRRPMLLTCESRRVSITIRTKKTNNITILSGNTTKIKLNHSNWSKWVHLWKAFNRKDILYNHKA